jgi:hypothetical protein
MLHALRHKKVRWVFSQPQVERVLASSREQSSNGDIEDDHGEEGYALREDTLTAMVFTRLSYLPSPLFWRLIGDACIPRLPKIEWEIENVCFWPRLALRSHGENPFPELVEPDLIIRCRETDLIVEAKRQDGRDLQRPEQLAREWRAWSELSSNERADNSLLLAIGGFSEMTENVVLQLRKRVRQQLAALGTNVRDVRLHGATWASFRKAIEVASAASSVGHERILLEDILSAFDLHDVLWKAPSWFADFATEVQRAVPIDLDAVAILLPQTRRNA